MNVILKQTLENLYALISEGQMESDARRALVLFREKSGAAFEDDQSYESRMALFTEWFIFDYPKAESSISAIDFYIASKGEVTDEERKILDALRKNVHDIFLVKWSSAGKMKLLSLYLDKYFIVEDENWMMFRNGDVFEARIVFPDGKWRLLNGFCHHPSKAGRFIAAEMKRIRKNNGEGLDDFILRLEAMSLMSQRARNIDINEIYKTEAA